MPQYSQEQMWKLFETLPDDLKDAIFSVDNANTVWEISKRNGIKKNDIPRLARIVGDVLMGLLPPEKLPKTLGKELALDSEEAETISREVNRFILFPVKDSLEKFYKEIKFAPGGKIIKPKAGKRLKPETPREKIPKEKISKGKTTSTDIYREPVE